MLPPQATSNLLSGLVEYTREHAPFRMLMAMTSRGITESELEQCKRIADVANTFSSVGAVVVNEYLTASIPQEGVKICGLERSVLAPAQETSPKVQFGQYDLDAEMIDWDVVSVPREREKRRLSVRLRHVGKRKPPVESDPWA